MDLLELENILIKIIAKPKDWQLQIFFRKAQEEIQDENFRNPTYINQVFWRLLTKGLIYFDMAGNYNSPASWRIGLTEMGRAVAEGEKLNPNDTYGYSKYIENELPNISKTEIIYIIEALQAYQCKLYISAVVMAGVVAEKAYLDLAEAFVKWPNCASGDKIKKELVDPRICLATKKNKMLELITQYQEIPEEYLDNIRGVIDGMMDLIRTTRNDAGHPKGVEITRKRANAILQWLPYGLEKIHILRLFFEKGATMAAG